ncbi:serine hydrolase [Rheinheimera baltica]|uniref:Serine hydrolase n=1 Tax=Rheinheimera baltica TaxID=67576 RepID=A0ABT9I2Q7_9GAMM|nr:serine hydrolase [Rheinheimera baltica]MDP5137448.1 serine hydrolase [Rheinheimera baltica]
MKTVIQLLVIFVLLGYSLGVNAADAAWVARHNIAAQSFAEQNADLHAKGYQLTYLNGHNSKGQARYNAVWQHKPQAPLWLAFHDLTEAGYQNKVNSLKKSGYQPVMVNPFNLNGQLVFTAIFHKKNTAWYARHDMSHAQYQSIYNTQKAKGFRLMHVSGYAKAGQQRYAALWQKTSGPALRATHGVSSNTYQQLVNNYKAQGFAPVLVDVFHLNGADYYSAIWHNSSPRWTARHLVKLNDYQQLFNDQYYEGARPTVVVGYGPAHDVKMAAIFNNTAWQSASLSNLNSMIEDFRSNNNLSGLSIAITIDERLVYAKGFGLRDAQRNIDMTTGTVARIASNSKAITGAAASRLIEQGRLDPEARVFGATGLLNQLYTLPACRVGDIACQLNLQRLTNIRVLDVLEHTMGGWSNSSALEACSPLIHLGFGWNICNQDTDPTLGNASRNDYLSWIVQNVRLIQAPNGSMTYSNIGYNIAEQLIEVASGQSYAGYINAVFMRPSGADCVLARANNALFNNEVNYVAGAAYVMNHRRMAGHGGWVCSAIGYQRLMARLDGGNKRPDLISAAAFNRFISSERGGDNYAKGIRNTGGRLTHNGALRSMNSEYTLWTSDRMSIFLFADTQLNNYAFVGYTPLYNSIRSGTVNFPNIDLF